VTRRGASKATGQEKAPRSEEEEPYRVPAGQRIDGMMNLHISKLKDGKAVEHWEFMQPNDLMKMMGGPQPGK